MPRPAGAKTPHNARATPSPFAAERTQAAPPRNGKQTYRHTDQSNLSIDQVDSLRRQSNLSTLSLSPRRPSLARSSSTATTTRAPRRGTPLAYATGNGAGGDRTEDDSGFLGQSVDEAAPWTMVDRLRNWRNDAMTQHLYDSAKFWGGKVLGITGNADDVFWLAQIHFLTHQFAQAERILTTPRPPSSASTSTAPPVRLTDMSLACRYLAAQCQVRLGKWEEALEMVGRRGALGMEMGDGKSDGGIKLTASAAHLRGLIHLHMKATDLAKEAFMEALSRDVKCFESFEMLVGGEMMSSEEEWDFIQGLPFHAQTDDDAEFVRMMYTVRLKKISHNNDMAIARQRLADEYGLGEDPDVLCSRADELHSAMRYAECFKITSHILSHHPSHRLTLPLHLSCMHHLPNLRSKLFLVAHEMVDHEPDDAISWYAVGLWYFAGKRWEESRRFFGKSVLIDPRFGPAWLAYAHSFAYEGEHDQAITAYSTAQRHLPGSHLPLLFIGMQHLGLANVGLAEEYLEAAKEICGDDPLVLNELGVVALHNQQFDRAAQLFRETLGVARHVQSSPAAWTSTHLNLGHAYRKLKQWDKAHASFRRVIELDPRSAAAYSALGIVEHQRGNMQDSIARYHEALALAPGDPTTCDLLRLALDDVATQVSSQRLPFPGLPPRTLQSIDAQVAALEEEVLAGRELPAERDGEGEGEGEGELSRVREEEEGEEGESEVMRSGAVSRSEDGIEVSMEEEEEEEDEDGGSEGETMDMTGE
ncbi:cell division control protein 16 [Rhodotorula diobovata]|uniref:Cell division control protein 16 n=1 Tax=Rhodotorula diobovata TaxID=5288 RepID=A0A5C5G614_9BASI|nr:cell division control protein 16 [Rhodotorula diobovata]